MHSAVGAFPRWSFGLAGLTVLISVPSTAFPQVAPATVSSASYSTSITSNSIVVTFGSDLANTTASATTLPLPLSLGGTTVSITDSSGAVKMCPLLFVSPGQVNHLIPDGVALGTATIGVTSGDGKVTTVQGVPIAAGSVGIYSANSTGNGPPAGFAQRFGPGGGAVTTPLMTYDPVLKRLVAQPFDLGSSNDQTFLILFGTGVRGLPQSSFQAQTNNAYFPVSYAGPQGTFVGLDQVNVGPILPADAMGSLGNGSGDIVLKLFSVSSSGLYTSNPLIFRVIHPGVAPSAELLSSDALIRGQTAQQFSIWGNYFVPGGTVAVTPSDGLTMSNISVLDTRITFDLAVDAGAATGDRQLTVTTSNGTSQSLKLSVADASSPNPFLSNLAIASNAASFNFTSPGGSLTTGSLLNYHTQEVSEGSSMSCQGSNTSTAVVHPGQTSGSVNLTFTPALADNYSSGHYANVSFSVTDASGRAGNVVGLRVDDPVFGCQQMPVSQ